MHDLIVAAVFVSMMILPCIVASTAGTTEA